MDRSQEVNMITRTDIRDLALCISTTFAMVIILVLALSRTAWAS
jgi:hypothetical protein